MAVEKSLKADNTTSERTNKEYQNNKKYINDRLAKTAAIITKLSRYKEFREVVNQQVAKKFDGDYNVLLKDIVKAFTKHSALPKTEMLTSSVIDSQRNFGEPGEPGEPQVPITLLIEELYQDQSQPFVVNGQTIYPQIYIPFFGDEVQQPGDTGLCDNQSTQIYPYPVVVPFDGDESLGQDVFNGMSYDAFGSLINMQVSECFASKNTVWAVTINETSNQSGTTSTPIIPSGSSAQIGADAYMPSMTIKIHKEVWIKGASDINMKYAFSWIDQISPTSGLTSINYFNESLTVPGAHNAYSTYITDWGGLRSGDDIEIKKFTRRQVNNETQINIDFTYAPLSRPIYGNSSYYFYPIAGDYLYFVTSSAL